jgi:hypothetical protein
VFGSGGQHRGECAIREAMRGASSNRDRRVAAPQCNGRMLLLSGNIIGELSRRLLKKTEG